jgi:hypothetical protein
VSDLRCREVENTFSRGSHSSLSTPAWGIAMNMPPIVKFFSGRSELFARDDHRWCRLTPEDEAHDFTGFNRETNEVNVGIYATRRPNGLVRVGFDVWRIGANLRPLAIERLENRWRQEATSLSKSLFRSASRRSHFSKSFARFEIAPERLEAWRCELESILSNPDAYESI